MKIYTTIVALLLTCAHSWANERLNVVLFFTDDMGYGQVQRFHPEKSKVPTPHLNNLCDEGMMFTDAHTSSSVCTPSRYSLLTGRYNWRSKHQRGVTGGGRPCLITEDRRSLAHLFKDQGYNTAMFGKWHLDFRYRNVPNAEKLEYVRDKWNFGRPKGTKILDGPVHRGFDHFRGFHHSGSMSSIIVDDEVQEYVECVNIMSHLTDAVVEYIDTQSQTPEPFFLYYPMNSPHAPVVPQEEWKERGVVEDPWGYSAFVAQTDDAIGQVLSALERNGIAENTIILFATDNGCHIKPQSFFSQGHEVSGPFRGKKKSLYDGGHRTPFIVKWPGLTTPGSRSNILLCMTDVYATFSDYFTATYDANTAEDSISFFPALQGQALTKKRKTIVHHDYDGHFAIRKNNYKLILKADTLQKELTGVEKKVQLYDLDADIAEANNIANQNPEIVDELITLLEQQVEAGRITPGPRVSNDTHVDIWKYSNK